MAGARSRAQAETKAINGNNECQDSQAIFEMYAKQFGVGVTSSSPRSRRDLQVSDRDGSTSPVSVAAASTPATSPTVNLSLAEPLAASDSEEGSQAAANAAQSKRRRLHDQSPEPSDNPDEYTIADSQPTHLYLPAGAIASQLVDPLDPDQSLGGASTEVYPTSTRNQADAPWSDRRLTQSPSPSRDKRHTHPHAPHAAPLRKRKMDGSQASPTQKNDERDYQGHYDSIPRSGDSPIPESPPLAREAGDQGDEDRTHDGLVHFGSLDFLGGQSESQRSDAEPSSPILEGPGLANTRHGWKLRTSSSQQHSSVHRPEDGTPFKPATFAPETPAPPINPFAGNARLGGQALAASQMFGNTQQLSSAVKAGFSPTSSRPSPNLHLHHHSISTNAVDSPLKNPYNITSPTVADSSPAIPASRPRTSSSFPEHQTPAPARWREDDDEEDTPGEATARPPRRFREPMGTYVSMKESQERRASSEILPIKDSFYDSDDAMAAEVRRKRVARKKDEALRELAEVSFRRPGKHDGVEVPSTTQKIWRNQPLPESPTKNLNFGVKSPENDREADDDVSTVADSQEAIAPAVAIAAESITLHSPGRNPEAATGAAYDSSNERIPDSTGCTAAELEDTLQVVADEPRSEDKIPETSPICAARSTGHVEQPLPQAEARSEPEFPPTSASLVEDDADPQLPQPSRRSGRTLRPSARARMILSDDSSSVAPKLTGSGESRTAIDAAPKVADADELKVRSDMSVIPESSPRTLVQGLPSSPPTKVTPQLEHILESREEPPSTPTAPPATALSASSSSLTQLTNTPELPDDVTPTTQPSGSLSRRRQSGKSGLPQLKTAFDDLRQSPGRNTRRGSRQSGRLRSTSTDELARSPSAVGFENSMIRPHKTGSKVAALQGHIRPKAPTCGEGLFSDMAFAVSFQSRRPGESADACEKRMALSSDIERQILEGGGRLLSKGFDELFEPTVLKTIATSPMNDGENEGQLGLAPASRALGFTALIADGHSRKAKYMQALALGLPCISDRWISTCMSKKSVVDWTPYLLCAGQSAYLRGAIRSRVLQPYEATTARLVDVVERRTKLLEGGKILLVMKKSRQEDKKMMYVFLTHVLGASLVRAHTVAEAQEMIRQRELLQDPFDWVYVDGNTGTDEELFGNAAAPTSTASKKRKRSSAVTAAPARKKIRTLNDELVIQSLILGRMIEEEDLEG